VDLADLLLWRENFGRTLSEAAPNSALAVVQSTPDTNLISDNAVSTATTPSLAAATFNSIESRNRPSRARWRPPAAVAALRDDALLAWTAARFVDRFDSYFAQASMENGVSPFDQFDELRNGRTGRDLSLQLDDAFDLAFESLGA
jgi:hypothetical protein